MGRQFNLICFFAFPKDSSVWDTINEHNDRYIQWDLISSNPLTHCRSTSIDCSTKTEKKIWTINCEGEQSKAIVHSAIFHGIASYRSYPPRCLKSRNLFEENYRNTSIDDFLSVFLFYIFYNYRIFPFDEEEQIQSNDKTFACLCQSEKFFSLKENIDWLHLE